MGRPSFCAALYRILLANWMAAHESTLGIETEGLTVTIRENVDPRVLFALREPDAHTSCLGSLEVDITVSGEISDEDLATLQSLASYSPVYGLIAEPIKINHRVRRA